MEIRLQKMSAGDIDSAVGLIASAMNRHEATWAKTTIEFHFQCLRHKLIDGRSYYVWKEGDSIVGLVGLHNYIWGPKENVWLAWFAVEPAYQGKGYGSRMLSEIEKLAVSMGYKKFFVETYDNPVFDKARSFYQARGFFKAGVVNNYLPDKSPMVVYQKLL
jgi:GNAT superfamily N-acetyltransferase